MRACAAAVMCLALGACGWTPADEQVLLRFFERSRLYDRTRLEPIATVVFDPRVDGVVERFHVVERGPERPGDDGRVVRDVTLDAIVRSASGQERPRQLRVTLERRDGAWIVTRVR